MTTEQVVAKTVEKLIEFKEAYYNDEPLISDEAFDALENTLREMDPQNDYFSLVGIPVKGEKIKHLIPMLSQKKAKSIEEVVEWLNKITDKKVELIIEPKIDGLSANIVYDKGKLQYITTRGDGVEGRIITHISDYIEVPKTININTRVEVRGELYISKYCNFPNPNEKPLRNLAVGLVNRKDTGLEDLRYISFVAYQIFGSEKTSESEKVDLLQDLGFKIITYITTDDVQKLTDYFETYKEYLRDRWEYETDGLVVVVNDNSLHEEINAKYTIDHHWFHTMALKPPSDSKWTVVNDITWQVSKYGYLIPVVNVKAVTIGGAEIKNVTANNFQNVKKLKISKGDKIHISRSNDVIPFLIESTSSFSESNLIPKSCPSCNSKLDEIGVHLICSNTDCKEKNIQIIVSWVKDCEMDQVAESSIRALVDAGYVHDIISLYELHLQDIKLDGFGDKKIDNLLAQIEKSRTMSIVDFISRLPILLVGKKAVKKLGITSLNEFLNFNDTTRVIGQNIIDYTKQNTSFIANLVHCLNISDVKKTDNTKKKVCMTGAGPKGRKDLIKYIESSGYEFSDSINKELSILVCEDVNGSSSKLQKAKKLGIKLMTYTEFFK
jgi:DNA ligase (NAD+)